MKIGIFIPFKIEICYEALVGHPLPPSPVSFPENSPISTRYAWGIWGPTDSPLRLGLYLPLTYVMQFLTLITMSSSKFTFSKKNCRHPHIFVQK